MLQKCPQSNDCQWRFPPGAHLQHPKSQPDNHTSKRSINGPLICFFLALNITWVHAKKKTASKDVGTLSDTHKRETGVSYEVSWHTAFLQPGTPLQFEGKDETIRDQECPKECTCAHVKGMTHTTIHNPSPAIFTPRGTRALTFQCGGMDNCQSYHNAPLFLQNKDQD